MMYDIVALKHGYYFRVNSLALNVLLGGNVLFQGVFLNSVTLALPPHMASEA